VATTAGVADIVALFLDGSEQDRAAFVESSPPGRLKDMAVSAAGSQADEMRPQALDFLAASYAAGGPFDWAAKLGEATFRVAAAMHERGGAANGNFRMIAGRGALNWLTGLQRQGDQQAMMALAPGLIDWLVSAGDRDNVDSLRLKQVETAIDLQDYDLAESILVGMVDADLPELVALNYRTLREQLDRKKGGGTRLSGEIATRVPGAGEFGDIAATINEVIGRLFRPPEGGDNEFTVRQRILDASAIFLDPRKANDPVAIGKIEPELVRCRDWMREHHLTDGADDASWSLYLCYSRTQREALALRELERIRVDIERIRRGMADPNDRGLIAARYPLLYRQLAAMAWKTGNREALLVAIESSKGRIVADLLTRMRGVPEDETAWADPVTSLREAMQRTRAHYLTFMVDADATYAVLVDKHGELHADRVAIAEAELRRYAAIVDPRTWVGRDPATLERRPRDLPERLGVLLRCLMDPIEGGVIEADDHLCVSTDGAALPLPLHYLRVGDRLLADLVSVSRIHGGHLLCDLLSHEATRPSRFLSLEVPARQDLDNSAKVAALSRPGEWLARHVPSGRRLTGKHGDIATLRAEPLADAIVHFATHGTFPDAADPSQDPNPFRSSGLLLAAGGALPDLSHIPPGSDHLLTPERVVDLRLGFSGSHLTLHGCVTGLAKSSVAGDALGLEFAFLQLGARSILSSHWNTEAAPAAAFAEAFYDAWLTGRATRAQAWRHAVRTLRAAAGDDRESLHTWSAFSLSGDWR
jgi:CHAT domain-containing protein